MKIFRFALIAAAMLTAGVTNAQYNSGNATVTAQNYDISDNLDLQAVASIFGESRDLEDFERRLNDPSAQISNLDLNNDGYVDYLRVVEVGEGNVRVIVVQAVMGQDQFQDVATIELERQRNKSVQVQIVGNSYLYGSNYIYEPYYYSTPVFFDMFWLATYRPYYSPWYWGYYPTYYSYWRPMPIFSYHSHIYSHIDHRNRYSYTDNRRLVRSDRMYSSVRGNSLERQSPNRSFASRNNNAINRRSLDTNRSDTRTRGSQTVGRDNGSTISRTHNLDNRNISNNRRGSELSTGRQRVSTEEFSRARSNSNASSLRTSDRSSGISTNRNNSSTFSRSTNRVESAPSNSRIERSSRVSQPSRNVESSSRSNSSFSRSSSPSMRSSSSPSMSRSSAPSMSRSSGSMGGGRSSSGGGMTRGGR